MRAPVAMVILPLLACTPAPAPRPAPDARPSLEARCYALQYQPTSLAGLFPFNVYIDSATGTLEAFGVLTKVGSLRDSDVSAESGIMHMQFLRDTISIDLWLSHAGPDSLVGRAERLTGTPSKEKRMTATVRGIPCIDPSGLS